MTTSSSRRRAAACLGVLSVAPLLLMLVGIAGFALDAFHLFNESTDFNAPDESLGFSGWGLTLFTLGIPAATFLTLLAFVCFAADATRNPAVPAESRAVWVLILLIGSAAVFPVYWLRFWWRPEGRCSPATTGS